MKKDQQLRQRRKELLKELTEMPFWVNGSVVETTNKSKGKETPFYYLSQSIKGKNKITYISARHLPAFKAAAAEGAKLKELLAKLSFINTKLIKESGIND